MSNATVAEAMFEATKPFGVPWLSKDVESDTVWVVTSVPPPARSACRTRSIAVAFACSAPLAVDARVSTPAEISARSGTASTTP